VNNSCIANDFERGFHSDCNHENVKFSGNTIYTQSGRLNNITLCDPTNVVKKWPSDQQVIAMGKAIIGWTDE